ncbi:hypothetical protein B0O99DRAFT_257905 [Bisporella sp. PMI_857]|nr:hypothetical protein B0O99DRAFT_257905 [Bisporella sp. PMI_857]
MPTSYTYFRIRKGIWARLLIVALRIFLSGSLTLKKSATIAAVVLAIRRTWRKLRFEIPELAAVTGYNGNKAYMRCTIPEDSLEANAWVSRTIFHDFDSVRLGFEELRKRLLQQKEKVEWEQVFLLVTGVRYGNLINSIDVMLNICHQVTDGIGTRIILGRFLHILADFLSRERNSLDQEIDWKSSAKNLSVAWIQMMNAEQENFGTNFEKSADHIRDVMFTKLVIKSFPKSLNQWHGEAEIVRNLY